MPVIMKQKAKFFCMTLALGVSAATILMGCDTGPRDQTTDPIAPTTTQPTTTQPTTTQPGTTQPGTTQPGTTQPGTTQPGTYATRHYATRHHAARHYATRHTTGNHTAWNYATDPVIRRSMLYTIAIILLVLWLLGLVTAYTVGGFLHILLVIAIVLVIVRLITGNRAV
jgi:hypothetical protein